jgi:hypothetical protein
VFSADGFAHTAIDAKGKQVVATVGTRFRGKTFGPYDGVSAQGPVFSPDGKKMAFAVRRKNQWRVVVNGQESQPFHRIGKNSLVFGPDSRRLAYAARLGFVWQVRVGKHKLGPCLGFVRTSRIVFDGPDKVRFLAIRPRGKELKIFTVEVHLP